jgi:two-component system chemotaxis response regulator CheY
MTNKRVLSVGQCGADHWALTRALEPTFQAEVVPAATAGEALEQLRLGGFALVLVNRVFDLDGASGVEFIRQLQSAGDVPRVPIMLVSNYEEAQQEALAAGAVPGFGKAALAHPQTTALLRKILE